jgi:hypothetical protein
MQSSKKLEFTINFGVPAKIIYNALTETMEILKYTRTKAEVDKKIGGTFSIFEGKI